MSTTQSLEHKLFGMKQLVLELYLEVSGRAIVTEERHCFECGASARSTGLPCKAFKKKIVADKSEAATTFH